MVASSNGIYTLDNKLNHLYPKPDKNGFTGGGNNWYILSCEPSIVQGEFIILLHGFEVEKLPKQISTKNQYDFQWIESENSWVGRLTFDRESKTMQPCGEATASVLVQKSSICQLLEVGKNLIVASCEPRTILVFQDWKCVKRYNDSD